MCIHNLHIIVVKYCVVQYSTSAMISVNCSPTPSKSGSLLSITTTGSGLTTAASEELTICDMRGTLVGVGGANVTGSGGGGGRLASLSTNPSEAIEFAPSSIVLQEYIIIITLSTKYKQMVSNNNEHTCRFRYSFHGAPEVSVHGLDQPRQTLLLTVLPTFHHTQYMTQYMIHKRQI